MPRLIHLLAHHPDFAAASRDDDDVVNFAAYFNYYFDAVVKSDSLVLVYHYCQRIKQVLDALKRNANDDQVCPNTPSLGISLTMIRTSTCFRILHKSC